MGAAASGTLDNAAGSDNPDERRRALSRQLASGALEASSSQAWQDLIEGGRPENRGSSSSSACTGRVPSDAGAVVYAVRGDSGKTEKLGQPLDKKGEERARLEWGQSMLPGSFAAACRRGWKPAPNQDNYCFVEMADGNFIIGVMDGHGEWGHEFSAFVSYWLPLLIVRSPLLQSNTPEALEQAFAAMSKLVATNVQRRFPVEAMSGCTCVVVVKSGSTLYVANLGDSRAVVYSEHMSHALTEDHKPDRPIERSRISDKGGTVMNYRGGGARLVDRQCTVALAMSRAFGDTKVANLGLSDEPDVKIYPLIPRTPYCVVVGSDGLWDHMSCEEIRQRVWQGAQDADDSMALGSAQERVATCAEEASKRWKGSEGDHAYVDDITCLLVEFVVTD
eukprot:TRINITY_DN9751_c0_g2_i5.p1 TRINITY_DN9751_c0_g2~~TRINITY_DN9751_c0_g2_i5.p1  ORF type:complete len:392 (-),score=84.46 TRINITY_DN9751_c0_g2_i5:202-1377(-)